MSDPAEQQVARRQLSTMLHYAETAGCRRREVLGYFGEVFEHDNCGGCDNCLEPRETYDGTLAAQKFLSCIIRIAQASRFSVGMNHVIEVLTGAETEKIRRWGHDRLTTYGIGRDLSRRDWSGIGRELLRLGLVAVDEGEFATLVVTEEGAAALRERRRVTLTKSMDVPVATRRKSTRSGEVECDEILFGELRRLRKKLADERGVPAYVIFGDVTLREMAREYPIELEQLEGITGVGARKLEEYGAVFVATIAEYLGSNSRLEFHH
jgi:ATP-dependent DNA helicase RecQ